MPFAFHAEWNDWSANSQKEIDAMIDAYKQDESSTGRSANGHGVSPFTPSGADVSNPLFSFTFCSAQQGGNLCFTEK